MNLISRNAQIIKRLSMEAGFDFCGISKAEFLEEEARNLDNWLNKNYHGKMAYMANYFDKRLDPRLLVEGAKSVITVILNYFPEEELTESEYKISKYAYGTDYHFVIKDKLKTILQGIQEEIGAVDARVFVDSAPVMDKAWAKKSGLGWVGKNSNIINRKIGSFFFIGEIICDLELEPDGPIKDYCGSCTACIDACPTDAIVEPYQVDGSKCISYLTIELKEQIPDEFRGRMENWAFGCDICQDVCPWNSFAKPHKTIEFTPKESLKEFKDWEEITQEVFSALFKKSPIKRTKLEGLKRNINFIKER
jgi:epoxyqueuosine reductase